MSGAGRGPRRAWRRGGAACSRSTAHQRQYVAGHCRAPTRRSQQLAQARMRVLVLRGQTARTHSQLVGGGVGARQASPRNLRITTSVA